jgi:hypothetical protein
MLGLLLACANAGAGAGASDSPGLLPPPAASFVGTVSVGTAVDAPHSILSQGKLTFAPFGSKATLGPSGFTADLAGDYLVAGPGQQQHYWRAVQLPRPPPAAPDPPAGVLRRFRDGFHRAIVTSAEAAGADVLRTDSRLVGWDRVAPAATCVQNDGELGLQLAAAACPGVQTSASLMLPSIFTEPLTLQLGGLRFPAGKAAQLLVSYSELDVEVQVSPSGSATATVKSADASSSPAAKASADASNCSGVGLALTLRANSVNCTLHLSCSDGTEAVGGDSNTELPAVWNGYGSRHGAHPVDARTNYTAGQTTLQLSGGALSLRSVALYSNLVAGNDPLRPTVSVPALPAVLNGITDETGGVGFPTEFSDLGLANARAAAEGIVDVSAPPFSADPSGKTDSTEAIQAAVDWAREHYCAVFFPAGEYVVSDTIIVRAVPRYMAQGHVPGPAAVGHKIGTKGTTDDFILDGVSSRYVPNYLVGTTQQGRTAVIKLKPSSKAFLDATKPAYVFDFFFENSGGQPEPNAQYNSMATNLKIIIGEGNVGAVGIRLRGAQGSGLEDVTVDAGPGLAGVVGGCGSGGAHHGLRVIGGRYGLDLRQSQPTGTVSGTTLEGQRCAAIVYAGFESLSAVGINMTDQRGCYGVISTDSADSTFDIAGAPVGECTLPMMPTGPGFPGDYQQTNPYIAGKMSFIDSTIDFSAGAAHCATPAASTGEGGGSAGFLAVRSLFLQNVYVKGTDLLYVINGTFNGSAHPLDHSSEPCASGGCHVEKMVYGIDPPMDRTWQLHAPVYIDGVRQASQKLLRMGSGETDVPSDLITKHRWAQTPDPPSFESPRCVNVKTLGAKGDGWTDDYDIVQNALDENDCVYLPRGLYLTSRTLQVRAGRALVGVARHLSRITSVDAGLLAPPRHHNPLRDPASKVLPVVEVLPTDRTNATAAKLTTTLQSFSISIWNHLDTTSALHFHADNGIYRQMHANRANRCGGVGTSPFDPTFHLFLLFVPCLVPSESSFSSWGGSNECRLFVAGLYRPGCKDSVEIDYPLEMVSGAKQLKMYTFYDEDCCHEHTNSVSMDEPGVPAYWSGFLAGPQGPKCAHAHRPALTTACTTPENSKQRY